MNENTDKDCSVAINQHNDNNFYENYHSHECNDSGVPLHLNANDFNQNINSVSLSYDSKMDDDNHFDTFSTIQKDYTDSNGTQLNYYDDSSNNHSNNNINNNSELPSLHSSIVDTTIMDENLLESFNSNFDNDDQSHNTLEDTDHNFSNRNEACPKSINSSYMNMYDSSLTNSNHNNFGNVRSRYPFNSSPNMESNAFNSRCYNNSTRDYSRNFKSKVSNQLLRSHRNQHSEYHNRPLNRLPSYLNNRDPRYTYNMPNRKFPHHNNHPISPKKYINDGCYFPLTQNKVMTAYLIMAFANLGDNTVKLPQQIVNVGKAIIRVLFHNFSFTQKWTDVGTIKNEFTIDSFLKEYPYSLPTHFIANVATISTSLLQCVSYSSVKSSIYASLVGYWAIHQTRPPSSLDKDHLKNLFLYDMKIEHDGSSDNNNEFCNKDEMFKFLCQSSVINGFIKVIINTTKDVFTSHISNGFLMEAKNVLRFIIDLANISIIALRDIFKIMEILLSFSLELSAHDVCYAEALLDVVTACLPWLSVSSIRTQEEDEQFNWCLDMIDSILEQKQIMAGQHFLLKPVSNNKCHWNLTLAVNALKKYKSLDSYASKSLYRMYVSSSDIVECCTIHEFCVTQVLSDININLSDIRESLRKHRTIALNISIYEYSSLVDIHPKEDLKVKLYSSFETTQNYAHYGVGNGSIGWNGFTGSYYYISLWSERNIEIILKGVKPLDICDRWILRELVLSVLHNFRHTIDLCCYMLLKIPVKHDHFEIILIEVIINEIFRLPHPNESKLFFFRLLILLSSNHTSLIPLVNSAIHELLKLYNVLDMRLRYIFIEFVSLWMSSHTDTNNWPCLEKWSPHGIMDEWSVWENLNYTIDTPYDRILELTGDHDSEVQLQLLPKSIKEFLLLVMDRLCRLIWYETVKNKVPEWLHPYLPMSNEFLCPLYIHYKAKLQLQQQDNEINNNNNGVTDTTLQSNSTYDIPIEYILFRQILQTKALNDQEKKNHCDAILSLIFTKLLNYPPLVENSSDTFRMAFLPVNYLKSRHIETPQKIEVKPEKFDISDEFQDNPMIAHDPNEYLSNLKIENNYIDSTHDETAPAQADMSNIKYEDGDKDNYINNANLYDSQINTFLMDDIVEINLEKTIENEIFHYQESTHLRWNYLQLVDLFVRALLAHSVQSITHFNRLISNYSSVLYNMCPSRNYMYTHENTHDLNDSEYYMTLLQVIFSVWPRNMGTRILYTMEALFRHDIIPLKKIQEYVIIHILPSNLNLFLFNDLCHLIVREALRRLLYKAQELKKMKQSLFSLTNDDDDQIKKNIMELESQLSELQSEVTLLIEQQLFMTFQFITNSVHLQYMNDQDILQNTLIIIREYLHFLDANVLYKKINTIEEVNSDIIQSLESLCSLYEYLYGNDFHYNHIFKSEIVQKIEHPSCV